VLQPYGNVRSAKKTELLNLVRELQIKYTESLNKTLSAKMTAWVEGMRITEPVLATLLDPETINPEREQLVQHCFQGLARSTITKTELPRLRATINHAIINGRDDLKPFLDWLYKAFSDATTEQNKDTNDKLLPKRENRITISKSVLNDWINQKVQQFDTNPNPYNGALIISLCTGRRAGEVLATCDYRLNSEDKLMLSNLAKRRGNADAWEGVEVEAPIMFISPETLIRIWDKVRTLAELRGINRSLDYRQLNQKISKECNRTQKPVGVEIYKDSRDVYAAVVADKFRDGDTDPTLLVTRVLAHGLPGESKPDASALTYTKYRIVD
jgi:hypothetical protein